MAVRLRQGLAIGSSADEVELPRHRLLAGYSITWWVLPIHRAMFRRRSAAVLSALYPATPTGYFPQGTHEGRYRALRTLAEGLALPADALDALRDAHRHETKQLRRLQLA